jgi:hypothetical protein
LTDLPDDLARLAIGDGAAVEMHRVKVVKDWSDGGQTFAAQFDYDLTAEQLQRAQAAGAVARPEVKEGTPPEQPAAEPKARRNRGE